MFADEYRRQAAWRSWDTLLDALPSLAGATIVDLGCAIGDQAALLAARGARVLGFDGNEEFLAIARAKNIPDAEFYGRDLRAFTGESQPFDGLWCSFTAAYFPELSAVLPAWIADLRPGGWVAITEIDDLFGHEPVEARTRELLDAYADHALRACRYDFRMGRRLAGYVEDAGLRLTRTLTLPDRELAFDGPAEGGVLEAWRARLARMHTLRHFCGGEFDKVQADFLNCLENRAHRSSARVLACLAIR